MFLLKLPFDKYNNNNYYNNNGNNHNNYNNNDDNTCFASSPGRSSLTEVWISLEDRVCFLLSDVVIVMIYKCKLFWTISRKEKFKLLTL